MTAATSMTAPRAATPPDPANDPRIDPRVRAFLAELNKDSSPFWELPGPQVRAVLTGLQAKTPVDLSGITVAEKNITAGGRTVKLYVVKPEHVRGTPPVILFIHGGVWIAGDFENHKRFVRDLVVGSGAAAVFVEYTPIPDAVYPTQIEESYAAAKWVAEHGADIGVDGRRMAVAAADATLREARHAVWEMRAPELDELDLPGALRAAAYDAVGSAPIALTVTVRGARRRLPPAAEVAALRIGREAVTNAARHAGAQSVEVTLEYGPRTLTVGVRDDGRGLTLGDVDTARQDGHWGLVGMRERAAAAGGTLEVAPAPGGGTLVSAMLPTADAG